MTWKTIDGKKGIKCRLTMRGFKDRTTDLETFAGTASRCGQRVVNTMAAQEDTFELWSFDVSQAFAKGLTFDELAELTDTPLRKVEFDLSPEDVAILKQIPGYETFDPTRETLSMSKAMYGLKDAPRAWRKRLHQVLTEFGYQQLRAEPELYVLHDQSGKSKELEDGLDKAIAGQLKEMIEVERQGGTEAKNNHRTRRTEKQVFKKILGILSAHVDDLKGASTKSGGLKLLKALEAKSGPYKSEWNNFLHTGIQHDRRPGGIMTHQQKYVENLLPNDLSNLKGDDEELVSEEFHSKFNSLLGGVAWTILTRPDLAVYVQALQRRGAGPRVADLKRLSLAFRYLKRHKLGIWSGQVPKPWRIQGFSDSAFRAQENESTGLALRGLAVLLTTASEVTPTSPTGAVCLVDFLVRRLRRVVRSTFSAELNAVLDSIETLLVTQICFHQVLCGTTESPAELMRLLETGQLHPPIELVTDARSVL